MTLGILILLCAFGVLAALIGVYNEFKRRNQAKKDWEEFNRSKDL